MAESGGSGSTTDEARQRSQEVAQQGQQKASEYTEEGRQRAKSQINARKEQAAGQLDGVVSALRRTGEQLREQDQGSIGQYADRAADGAEQFSGFLRDRDADQLIGEVEDFARQRPVVFLGGAFVVGLLGARFLKSSAGQSDVPGGSSGGNGDEPREIEGGSRTIEGESSYGEGSYEDIRAGAGDAPEYNVPTYEPRSYEAEDSEGETRVRRRVGPEE